MKTQHILKICVVVWVLVGIGLIAAPVSRVTNFNDGQVLTASQLNSEFNNVITGVNSINNAQIATNAAISPTKIAATIKGDAIDRDGTTGALSAKVDDSTIEISGDQLQIPTGGVTTTQILDGAIATVDIADDAITTAKILDSNVTYEKLEDLNIQTSSSSGNFTTSSQTPVDITNLSISITTSGRPVMLLLVSADTTITGGQFDGGNVGITDADGLNASMSIGFLRDSTGLSALPMFFSNSGTSTSIPCSSFSHIDSPAAGTYTYKVQGEVTGSGNTLRVNECKLVAYEL